MTYLRRKPIPKECCGHCAHWWVDRDPSNLVAKDYDKTGECIVTHRVRRWPERPMVEGCFEREVGADDDHG